MCVYRWQQMGMVVALLLVGGCGQRDLSKPKAYPTEGKVTVGGRPLAFVGIELLPKEAGKGARAWGQTGADGTFVLRSLSNEEPDGAIPGEYKVHITEWDPVVNGALPPKARPSKVPPHVAKPDLTVTVKAEDNDLQIDIP